MPNVQVPKRIRKSRGSNPDRKPARTPRNDASRSKSRKPNAVAKQTEAGEPVGRVRAAGEAAIDASPHVDAAIRYCREVRSGKVAAGKWTRLACERQLEDLARSDRNDLGFPFIFDRAAAERVCKFVELSPHVKGKRFAGTLIHLEDWQCFILTTVFGWLHRVTRLRRFRRAYTEVAKGNGKSALTSAVANYMAFAENEPGAEVYSAATTRDQAKIVFSVSQSMLRAMPEFCDRAGVEVATHSINQIRTNSFFRTFSSDANSAEGSQPYFTCVDELHAHPSRDLYDNLDTANGKRDGSLLWSITTAGSDQAGICYEVHQYVARILDGTAKDESFFGIIFALDDDDDWGIVENLRKANPNWGISVDPAEIGQKLQKALQLASAQPGFKTKHGNLWVNADHAWMDMVKFRKGADPKLVVDTFRGQPCIIGLDLANKIDILAAIELYWRDESLPDQQRPRRHYYCFGTYWLPEARIEQAQNAQYQGWNIQGRIRTTPGEVNDYDEVEDWIRERSRSVNIRDVGHDPWNATEIVNHLQRDGLTCTEVPQTVQHLNEPMNELEAAVYDGRFHYDGDPVLEWAVSNVVAHRDRNDNIFPTKEKAEKKIDPVTALLNAVNRVQAQPLSASMSVVGNCVACGELCLGTLRAGEVVFDCGNHKKK
jgi:phage terminase large subunit-like protein